MKIRNAEFGMRNDRHHCSVEIPHDCVMRNVECVMGLDDVPLRLTHSTLRKPEVFDGAWHLLFLTLHSALRIFR